MYVPAYGPSTIRALTRASGPFFRAPPGGFSSTPLLSPRDTLLIARADQLESASAFLEEMRGEVGIRQLEGTATQLHSLPDFFYRNEILISLIDK